MGKIPDRVGRCQKEMNSFDLLELVVFWKMWSVDQKNYNVGGVLNAPFFPSDAGVQCGQQLVGFGNLDSPYVC